MINTFLIACALPMSTLQTGRTVPPGQVEVDGSVGVNVSTAFVGGSVAAAKLAADEAFAAQQAGEPKDVPADDRAAVVRYALASALFLPVPIQEGALRVGIVRHVDAGLRMSSAGWGAEGRVQLADVDDGAPFDLAVGLLLHRQSFAVPLPYPVSELIDLNGLSRTDLAIPVAISRDFQEYGYVYGGARLQYTHLRIGLVERLSDASGVDVDLGGAPMWVAGGYGGGGLGWRYLFAFVELDAAWHSWRPDAFGRKLHVDGLVLYPTLGLKVRSYRLQQP